LIFPSKCIMQDQNIIRMNTNGTKSAVQDGFCKRAASNNREHVTTELAHTTHTVSVSLKARFTKLKGKVICTVQDLIGSGQRHNNSDLLSADNFIFRFGLTKLGLTTTTNFRNIQKTTEQLHDFRKKKKNNLKNTL